MAPHFQQTVRGGSRPQAKGVAPPLHMRLHAGVGSIPERNSECHAGQKAKEDQSAHRCLPSPHRPLPAQDDSDHVLHDFQGAPFEADRDPLVSRDSVVTEGLPCYGTFAHDRGMLHVAIVARQGERVYEGFHIQIVNAYAARLKD